MITTMMMKFLMSFKMAIYLNGMARVMMKNYKMPSDDPDID
ncbi:MAG: hypothetical protein SPL22_02450 [Treponema sp.]|nr:hypothetical protein [Treponema sp.]MDY6396565.1 hypothetical protein [Treponema sp.]